MSTTQATTPPGGVVGQGVDNAERSDAGGTRSQGPAVADLLCVNFNQDSSSLAVGSRTGYALYSFSSVDSLDRIYQSEGVEDVCIVERLFSSSLVALVSLTAPRKLKVCHFKKQQGTEICNYSYSNTILNVKLNRARLVVCLEESLYIHYEAEAASLPDTRALGREVDLTLDNVGNLRLDDPEEFPPM